MRAFIAVPVPEAHISSLEALQVGLTVGRKVASENFHVTLAFLDDQPHDVLTSLDTELREIACPGFQIRLAGVDVFGGSAPRLLWVGVQGGEQLQILRRKIREAARRAGIELARERFRPHVTLARFPKRMHPDDVAKIGRFLSEHGGVACAPFTFSGFSLYQSTLTEDGPIYGELAEYPADGY